MMKTLPTLLAGLALAGIAAAPLTPAQAQDYPNSTINIIPHTGRAQLTGTGRLRNRSIVYSSLMSCRLPASEHGPIGILS